MQLINPEGRKNSLQFTYQVSLLLNATSCSYAIHVVLFDSLTMRGNIQLSTIILLKENILSNIILSGLIFYYLKVVQSIDRTSIVSFQVKMRPQVVWNSLHWLMNMWVPLNFLPCTEDHFLLWQLHIELANCFMHPLMFVFTGGCSDKQMLHILATKTRRC